MARWFVTVKLVTLGVRRETRVHLIQHCASDCGREVSRRRWQYFIFFKSISYWHCWRKDDKIRDCSYKQSQGAMDKLLLIYSLWTLLFPNALFQILDESALEEHLTNTGLVYTVLS